MTSSPKIALSAAMIFLFRFFMTDIIWVHMDQFEIGFAVADKPVLGDAHISTPLKAE